MATQSGIPSWRIPWTRGVGRTTVHGIAKSSHMTEQVTLSLKVVYRGL